jgi:5S rRNA maturation endonuclease (ribonuclease M5)
MATFAESVDFIVKFTEHNLDSIKVSKKQKEKDTFVSTVKVLSVSDIKPIRTITRSIITKALNIPSPYFLNRNFSSEILIKYDVGDCMSEGKEMSNRAVVPIYDYDHKFMIGCSGRSINNGLPKWKHSDGFRAEECLYNYWYAKDFIKKTSVVILVESPGNVWRLEESGIHNSVALFGSSLKDKQKMLLDISGAMTIITIMDSDEAGKKAAEQIKAKCNKTYNVINLTIDYPDVAEMNTQSIKKDILPTIERYTI